MFSSLKPSSLGKCKWEQLCLFLAPFTEPYYVPAPSQPPYVQFSYLIPRTILGSKYYHYVPVVGCIAPPPIHSHLEPWNVTLFQNRVFADVIRILRWNYPGFRVKPNPIIGILMRTGEGTQLERQRLGWCRYKLRNTRSHQKLEEAGRILPSSLWKERDSVNAWFWTSDLQKCARVHFYCCKPPSLWEFLRAALGN